MVHTIEGIEDIVLVPLDKDENGKWISPCVEYKDGQESLVFFTSLLHLKNFEAHTGFSHNEIIEVDNQKQFNEFLRIVQRDGMKNAVVTRLGFDARKNGSDKFGSVTIDEYLEKIPD